MADAAAAGRAFADLADACIRALAEAALHETIRIGGDFPGEVVIIALGKAGSREMTARSDLDLMTLYAPHAPEAASALKGWSAETFYARFTQRLVAALSAPTGEGGLYEVDLQLRPSGTQGPVAVSLAAFERYYAEAAETWEFLALTRARVAWSTSDAFAAQAERAIETALRRLRDPVIIAADVREMRNLMRRERPAWGVWDLKLTPGGLVDIEFAAQHLQLLGAAAGGPLKANTKEALQALAAEGAASGEEIAALMRAWTLQQALSQILKLALEDGVDPGGEPRRFRAILAKTGVAKSFSSLQAMLAADQAAAHRAYEQIVATD